MSAKRRAATGKDHIGSESSMDDLLLGMLSANDLSTFSRPATPSPQHPHPKGARELEAELETLHKTPSEPHNGTSESQSQYSTPRNETDGRVAHGSPKAPSTASSKSPGRNEKAKE